MDLITCSNCGFTETIEDTFLETSIELTNVDGISYDVFCLKCPKCGHKTNYEFD